MNFPPATPREVPVRRIVLIPALAVLLSLGAGAAHAQYDNRGVYDRIDRLERDLQVMQAQAARGGPMVVTSPALGGGAGRGPVSSSSEQAPMPAGLAARLDDRVDQLEEMVRHLTGKLEENQFKTAQIAKQLERMQADMELRFKDLQAAQAPAATMPGATATAPAAGDKINLTPPKGTNGADAAGPAPGPQTLGTMPEKDMKKLLAPQTAAAPAAPAKALDPQAVYEGAYAAAQSGDYANAERGFTDFLAKNPTHQLAGNAQYWLGDIAYSKKDFGTAAGTFLDAYKKFPKHTKAPDMIYKAGSSFGQLGKKKEACTAFTILFNDHPQMPDRVKRAAVAEKQKYDCK
ncbi:MAG: tol-pal system protein YbgF [Rhodospirillaceae bacterium]|nr:tol-pal system protein YbgF [Rhodospirillales bacterium]